MKALIKPLPPSHKKINQEAHKLFDAVKLRASDLALMLALVTLQDQFGFGGIRGQRFADAYTATAQAYAEEYGEAILEALEHHSKIKLINKTEVSE